MGYDAQIVMAVASGEKLRAIGPGRDSRGLELNQDCLFHKRNDKSLIISLGVLMFVILHFIVSFLFNFSN